MHIKWNKVTWYSKLAAVILFVGFVVAAFCFGFIYGKLQGQSMITFFSQKLIQEQNRIAATTSSESMNWQTYRNERYGFEFKYPNQKINITEVSDNLRDGLFSVNFSSAENNNPIDGGVNAYFNVPSIAYGNKSLNEEIQKSGYSYAPFAGYTNNYQWQCVDGYNVGGGNIRDCSIQEGDSVYDFGYTDEFKGILSRADFDLIVKSFHFE